MIHLYLNISHEFIKVIDFVINKINKKNMENSFILFFKLDSNQTSHQITQH